MELAHLHGVVFELLEQSLFTINNDTSYYVAGCCNGVNSRPIILGRFALDKGYIQGLVCCIIQCQHHTPIVPPIGYIQMDISCLSAQIRLRPNTFYLA